MVEKMGPEERDQTHVYVVDDDDDFRDSTILLLETSGFVSTGFRSATEFLESHESVAAGILLLDLRMPGVSGIDALESGVLTSRFATIVITGHGDIESAVRSLKAGAVDFLEKPFSVKDLLTALEAARVSLHNRQTADETQQRSTDLVSQLTGRELQVLQGLVAGLPYKLIAYELDISVRTVEMHRDKLIRRLGVRTNGEAVRMAVFANIQPMERRSAL